MTEKELLKQLKNLKQVRPSNDWQASNRQVLLQQVFNGQDVQALPWTAKFNLIMSRVVQPTAIALVIFVFLLGGSLLGFGSGTAKPGDSLYIAKRLSERAKLTVAFSSASKTKLNLQFANERAKELAQIIDQEDNQETVVQLRQDFTKQINIAKERLAKVEAQIVVPAEDGEEFDDNQFFSASSNKDEQGLDISIIEEDEEVIDEEENIEEITVIQAVEEIEQLIAEENLIEAVEKLEAMEDIMNQEDEDVNDEDSEEDNIEKEEAVETEAVETVDNE